MQYNGKMAKSQKTLKLDSIISKFSKVCSAEPHGFITQMEGFHKSFKISDSIYTMHIQVNVDSDLMSDSDLKQKFNKESIACQLLVYFERGSSHFNKLAI